MPSIRVIVAEDQQSFRVGLLHLLGKEPGIMVIADTDDAETAVRLAAELWADVVVIDVIMPTLSGIEATRRIKGAGTHAPQVVAMSVQPGEPYVTDMLNAGATAFISKDRVAEELPVAIRRVAAGGTFLTPAAAGHNHGWRVSPPSPEDSDN